MSGSGGRLLSELAHADISILRERLESELPQLEKRSIIVTISMLQRVWNVQLPPNDREFLLALGGSEDPGTHEILQQFQRLFFRAATERSR